LNTPMTGMPVLLGQLPTLLEVFEACQ